jgi:hypothetical protein
MSIKGTQDKETTGFFILLIGMGISNLFFFPAMRFTLATVKSSAFDFYRP